MQLKLNMMGLVFSSKCINKHNYLSCSEVLVGICIIVSLDQTDELLQTKDHLTHK